MSKKLKTKTAIQIYIDGSGKRPDGKGSATAWYRVDSGERKVQKIDGLTNNEAEYGAALSAVGALPAGSDAELLTDSELLECQYNGKWRVSNPRLFDLLSNLRDSISRKHLRIKVTWIPRRENLAGKMI